MIPMKVKAIENNKSGIYLIRNLINNKIYIGKSKNIYKRLHQHLYDFKNKRKKSTNDYLLSSWYKYGKDNFDYEVLEYLELNEQILTERELYWIDFYNSTSRNIGYNLRRDSSTKMITHPDTSKKISERLKKEWKSGIRDNHSKKLSENWKDNFERIENQSKLFSEIKTKYYYIIRDLKNKFIEKCNYSRLVELELKNVQATFHKKKLNNVKFKNFIIERVKIEDIVRSSKKFEKNN